MELWDVYDTERIKTGRTLKRGGKLNDNEFHLVVHICVFNSNDEMIIQQRQPFKDGWPNMWDVSAAGSAVAGENSSQAAERELYEEIGCRIKLLKERPLLTLNFSNAYDDYYCIEDNVNINNLRLQYEEVQKVKWASKEEIMKLLDEKKFIPYSRSFIKTLFDMQKHRRVYVNTE